MNEQMAKALARPFDQSKVKEKRGQGGRMMSYVSHGLITERLNDADPEWSWRPIATYTYASPDGRLHCEGVEVELTVGGVSRVEAGGPQRQDGFANEIKNAYSDALKRAAMRFGVALHMWETLVDAEGDEDYDEQPAPQRQRTAPRNANGYQVADLGPAPSPGTPAPAARNDNPTLAPKLAPKLEPLTPAPTAKPTARDEKIDVWTVLWKEARANGHTDRAALDRLMGRTSWEPAEVLDKLRTVPANNAG